MAKFDINKYKEVNDKEIDMKKTKHNLGIFLNAYLKARGARRNATRTENNRYIVRDTRFKW